MSASRRLTPSAPHPIDGSCSRPLRGCPREYAFLVDVDGAAGDAPVQRAMRTARPDCVELRVVGAYPTHRQ